MLNTLMCPKRDSNSQHTGYKSIALPAELQGHKLICRIFSLKSQLNQSIKNQVHTRSLFAARVNPETCSLKMTNLSAWSRFLHSISDGISFKLINLL